MSNFFEDFLDGNFGVNGYIYMNDTLMLPTPGFNKSDLKITLDDRKMLIEGEKEISGETYQIKKRFILPEGALNTNEAITAKVEDGLLYINLKKSERSKQKEIVIS